MIHEMQCWMHEMHCHSQGGTLKNLIHNRILLNHLWSRTCQLARSW